MVSTMLAVAKEKGAAKITEAKIKLGKLQQIDFGILRFALKELTKGTQLEKTDIKLEEEETKFKCRACGAEWNFNSARPDDKEQAEAMHFVPDLAHAFIRCPKCGSPDFEIIGGRGAWVEYMKVEE